MKFVYVASVVFNLLIKASTANLCSNDSLQCSKEKCKKIKELEESIRLLSSVPTIQNGLKKQLEVRKCFHSDFEGFCCPPDQTAQNDICGQRAIRSTVKIEVKYSLSVYININDNIYSQLSPLMKIHPELGLGSAL